jgi:hypothetical protein
MTATNPEPDEDADLEQAPTFPILHEARTYWRNAQQIGAPGQLGMTDEAGAALQRAHAHMATTAALISIAESLDHMATDIRRYQRRTSDTPGDLHTLAKEITRLRQGR